MHFIREHTVDVLRKGYVLRSAHVTAIEDHVTISQTAETFLPGEDFEHLSMEEQAQLIEKTYELLEKKLHELANAG